MPRVCWVYSTIETVQSVDEINDVQMMTRGWGDKAWLIIECSPSLTRQGILSMSRGFTPRHAQTVGDLGFANDLVEPSDHLVSGW